MGIRDTTKLKLWAMTEHPITVLLDYNIIIQQSFYDDLDFLLSHEDKKGFYIRTPPDSNGHSGVDTSFMMIKPSIDEFEKIVDAYKSTPYHPSTGWNGKGHHKVKGGMGMSGFLSYYFSITPGYVELDRCTYAHNADEDCLSRMSFSDSKVAKIYDSVCGNPRKCPG